jgi:hypothetical protein
MLKIHFAERYGGRMLEVLDRICPFEVVLDGLRPAGEWPKDGVMYIEEADWSFVRV